jgi:hypothetical protein
MDASIFHRGPRKTRSSVQHNTSHEDQRRALLDPDAIAHRVQEEIAERQEAEQQAVRAAEAELSRNLAALRSEDRTRVQNSTDDHSIFADPNEPKMFSSQDEADRYNREQIAIFLRSTPEYYPDPQSKNLATIGAYLERNGHGVIVSALKLKRVFERLSGLGLLVERPVQVTAPASVRVAPVAKVQTEWRIEDVYTGHKASDLFIGFDPNGSGTRVKLTARQIDALSVDEFKTFSRVTVAEKPDWAKIQDHESFEGSGWGVPAARDRSL